ncbi:MAG: ABC transporter substrate-binding protein [Novosphingobium sp.]
MPLAPPGRPILACLVVVLALAGCGSGRDSAVPVAVIGALPANAPAARGGMAANLVRGATAEGLVGFDEEGRVVPALADRWIVTDDGQSFIFRLRDGTWPDGSPITGESARAALAQALAAQRGGALALDLGAIAEVRAMAGRVIELRLARPEPDLLQLLAQPELGLLRKGRGAGPMRGIPHRGWLALHAVAPEDRGMPQEEDWADRARRVELHGLSGANAIARFNEGSMAVVLGGRIEDFPRVDIGGVSRGALRFDQVLGLFGLAVVHADGFLAKPENREALALAIDREGLVGAFGLGNWTATTRLVTPGAEGDSGAVGERWATLDLAARRAEATRRVAAWTGSGKPQPSLRIALPAGPGGDVLFTRIAADLAAVGLAASKVGPNAAADLRLVDRVAPYPRPAWFLGQLSCAARTGLCDSSADAIAARARSEPDPAARLDLIADAEATLTRANTFIPFGAPIRWSLVAGGVTGFAVNRWGVHPLMPLAMRPR